jgi:single-strand DNA-binding protein
MSGSVNRVLLVGNLGRDPEMRYLQSGEAVTTFAVATSRRWTGQDGQPREETEWHNVVAWRKLAETCAAHLTKGRKVYVEGRIQTRSWDDQQTGTKRYKTEIVADQVTFLDANPNNQGQGAYQERGAYQGQGGGQAQQAPQGQGAENELQLEPTPF